MRWKTSFWYEGAQNFSYFSEIICIIPYFYFDAAVPVYGNDLEFVYVGFNFPFMFKLIDFYDFPGC